MPRSNGIKGYKGDDRFVVEAKQKEGVTCHRAAETFIGELQKDHPYWIKEGNKLTCSLCQISFHFLTLTKFKIEESLIKIGSCIAGDDHGKKTKVGETSKQNEQEFTHENKNIKLLDMMREIEYRLTSRMDLTEKNIKCDNHDGLIDFETVYSSLHNVIPASNLLLSKKFISKAEDGINYFCEKCKELIFASMNPNEFRYNLWIHINDEGHRKIIPKNHSREEKNFEKQVQNLSEKVGAYLTDDLKYFEIGPVYHFLKCSLCNVAVSVYFHRLANHIKGVSHQNNKMKASEEYSDHSKINHNRFWFTSLMIDMRNKFKGSQFRLDIDHIQVGKMPGYVVCSLCSKVVLPTVHYLEEHFGSDNHVNNKATNVIKLESKFKINYVKTPGGDPVSGKWCDYSAFEESTYGITCHRCNVFMPGSSYILYLHMKKSRCGRTVSDSEAVK